VPKGRETKKGWKRKGGKGGYLKRKEIDRPTNKTGSMFLKRRTRGKWERSEANRRKKTKELKENKRYQCEKRKKESKKVKAGQNRSI